MAPAGLLEQAMGFQPPSLHELDAYATIDHPSLQPDEVESNLYLSSAYTEAALEVLEKHEITHILQVGYELEPHHPEVFVYDCIHLADRFDADIVQCLPQAFSFISQGVQNGKVLVHCVHGQSRSAAVVIAYLMWRDGKPYRECLQNVRACRPRVSPNSGFEMQLCLLADLGFDLNRWPGWSAATFMAVRQHQLLLQQSGELLPPPVMPQHHVQHQHQQQPQQQPHLLQQQDSGAMSADSEQQDLLILASPAGQHDSFEGKVCGCKASGLSSPQERGLGPALQVNVDVDVQHKQQCEAAAANKDRHSQPGCCVIM